MMEGLDLFRKLGAGAKFNYDRFRSDAERLKIIQPRQPPASGSSRGGLDFFNTGSNDSTSDRPTNDDASDSEIDDETDASQDGDGPDLLAPGCHGDQVGSRGTKRKKGERTVQKQAQIEREQLSHIRNQHHIHVHGTDIPNPVTNFPQLQEEYKVHPQLMKNVAAMGFNDPTPIQMQAMPVMLQGRELLACAPTGSGKTAAFILPILHRLKQPENRGFRALVLSPTRELAKQTHRQFCHLSEGCGFRVCIFERQRRNIVERKFGPKSSQKFDILVSTPSRLVYLLNQDPPTISLSNVEWLVVDESDKLFEEGKRGFRDQLATIYKSCDSRSLRRAMFSATFAHDVEEWCKLNLDNVVQVYIGAKNVASESVKQELVFVGSEAGKLIAIRDIIRKGIQPPVLVFVQSKERAKELFHELIYDGINVDVIHADRPHLQRDNVVRSFRLGQIWVLICTELMGRGIDFMGVNLVINYDFPNSAVSYIHRIGRTGRAGREGLAVTFFTEDDALNLRSIANVMKQAGCPVPDYMLQMGRPTQKARKKLAKYTPRRDGIGTLPYDYVKGEKYKKLKERRVNAKQRRRDDNTESRHVSHTDTKDLIEDAQPIQHRRDTRTESRPVSHTDTTPDWDRTHGPIQRAPEPWERTQQPNRRSPEPWERTQQPNRRSPEPWERTQQPNRRSPEPWERTQQPNRRSPEPWERTQQPNRRSPEPWERTQQPNRRSPEPWERTQQPNRRSPEPWERTQQQNRRSPEPWERTQQPNRRSPEPWERTQQPIRRSPEPWERTQQPNRRSCQPRDRTHEPNRRSPEPWDRPHVSNRGPSQSWDRRHQPRLPDEPREWHDNHSRYYH